MYYYFPLRIVTHIKDYERCLSVEETFGQSSFMKHTKMAKISCILYRVMTASVRACICVYVCLCAWVCVFAVPQILT